MHRVIVTTALIALALPVCADNRTVPKAASALVSKVYAAAAAQDLKSLRVLMTRDFVSSFGGDGGPEEALTLWASDPKYFQRLAKTTSSACELESPSYLVCPRNAGVGYRAGFKLVDKKWVFASFVAGD